MIEVLLSRRLERARTYRYAVLRVRAPRASSLSGGHSKRATPLPIPNRVVKPLRADGTWGEIPWESRSPPGYHSTSLRQRGGSRRFSGAWAFPTGADDAQDQPDAVRVPRRLLRV